MPLKLRKRYGVGEGCFFFGCCYLTVDFAMAASQNDVCLHNSTKVSYNDLVLRRLFDKDESNKKI
jgi:hypothetical protein